MILFAPSIDCGLSRVAAGGGTPAAVTTLDTARGESGHFSPIFLPDGRQGIVGLIGGDGAGVYLASLDSTERTLLVPGPVWPALTERGDLFYWLDSNLMAQRLDVAGRRMVGDPVLVAENVVRIGPTPGMAVSPRGDVISDSFHTQGFFNRESSLFKQVVPASLTDRRELPAARE